MAKNIKNTILLLLLLSCRQPLHAQIPGPVGDLLKKIRDNNMGRAISYDYNIELEQSSTHKKVDSVQGRIYYDKNRYIDSNAFFYTARSGNYYCKLNYAKKAATVYDLKAWSQKMHVSFTDKTPNPIGITESMLAQDANVAVDTSNRQFFRIGIRVRNQQVAYVQLDISRTDYTMVAAQLETIEADGPEDKDPYKRTYKISNVNNNIGNSAFDLSGIFTVVQGRPQLSSRYAHYTLTELVK